jgi:hypothetical protein
MSTGVPYAPMAEGHNPEYCKNIAMIFAKKVIQGNHQEICLTLKNLLEKISVETELINQDNLARGELVESVHSTAQLRADDKRNQWQVSTQKFADSISSNDPPEFWGGYAFYGVGDFIAGEDRYPWMPYPISKEELPF